MLRDSQMRFLNKKKSGAFKFNMSMSGRSVSAAALGTAMKDFFRGGDRTQAAAASARVDPPRAPRSAAFPIAHARALEFLADLALCAIVDD